MRRPEDDENVMKALNNYLSINGRILPNNAFLTWGIDFVGVRIDDYTVLRIGLPPVSNYPVRETEHTDKYLKKKALSAS
jgi:hypothetical protein